MRAVFLTLCAAAALAAALLLIGRLAGIGHPAVHKDLTFRGHSFRRQDRLYALLWGLGAVALAWGVSVLYCAIFGDGLSWSALWDAWKKYDGYHYLGLAEHGYAGYTEGGRPLFLVFFPLYPWLTRLVHLVIPHWQLAAQALSAGCYVGACVLFARLMTEEFGRRTARLALAFLTAYPFAFFFCSVHTESLFLLLSLACFYAIRRHRWPLAGLFGALAALTRMQGVLLALAAFAEYCLTEHPIRKLRDGQWKSLWRDLWGKLVWMAAMGVGTLVYLGLNWKVAGSPFAFTVFQAERWNQGSSLFLTALYKLWNGFWHGLDGYVAWTTWGPQLALFVFCMAALIYAVRRLPPTWSVYFFICVFLNYSLNNPLSCCRYMACAFPLPAALAVASARRPGLGRALLAAYAVLQGVFMLAYFRGLHVC